MTENDPTPVQPIPGGDAKIYVYALVATAAVNGLTLLGIGLFRPDHDNSAFYAALTAAFAPTYAALVGYLRGHATANMVQRVDHKVDVAAANAAQAKAVAVETRAELKENTALTAQTAEAVADVKDALPSPPS